MTITVETYPTIVEAAKLIWYDNGMINRLEPEDEKLKYLIYWLNIKKDKVELDIFESELSQLSEADLNTVCCGDEFDAEKLISEDLNNFLGAIFNEEYLEV